MIDLNCLNIFGLLVGVNLLGINYLLTFCSILRTSCKELYGNIYGKFLRTLLNRLLLNELLDLVPLTKEEHGRLSLLGK